jgi:iron complex outermembrane recepter protein
MKPTFVAAAAAALFASPVVAQTASSAPAPTQTVIITGNPLGKGDVATPSAVLSGDALVQRRAGSLGETLDNLPGVSSSYFGPNANRPVIRGQDGDRIRVLNNAGASLDASSLSFDHAVPIDPLVVERIEVLRGPAALLYGGSAVGGVVNAIDNRIPKSPLKGATGALETRLGGAANERAVSGLVELGGSGFAMHLDGFKRNTSDLRVPSFDRPLVDNAVERRKRVVNSASSAQGGSVGGSWVSEQGYVGASVDSYRNRYGIVAEDDVTINMRRDKLAVAGEMRLRGGYFSTVRAQAGAADYQHQEVAADGSVGTTFKTKGVDARFEAVHRPLAMGGGDLEGSLGAQWESSKFSALGEEAFVPSTRTQQAAAFVLARWTKGDLGNISAGMRAEQVRVDSAGDPTGAGEAGSQFGPATSRRFSPRSASLGAVWNIAAQWQATASLASTERAPTSYELFANGVHAATAAFERGNPLQATERGRNIDLAVAWRNGAHHIKLGAFDSRFANYILLAATGEPDFVDESGQALPVFEFQNTCARLFGFEIEGGWRVWKGTGEGAAQLELDGKLDQVRGSRQNTGEPLPRLAPLRATLGLNWQAAGWTARAEVQRAATQNRVPSTDVATAGWTLLNLSTSYSTKLFGSDALLFAKLQNATNQLAFSAGSIGTVRPLAPLPGRGLTFGMRIAI